MSRILALAMTLVLLAPLPGSGQQSTGPLTPPLAPDIKKIPPNNSPSPPPIPVEEIIRRFAANEDAYRKAFAQYTYQQTVRVQEFGEDGKAAGEFQLTGEIYLRPDGQRYERIMRQPPSTLRRTVFTMEDVKTLASLPLFVLTNDQLDKYSLSYQGQQKLDELNTYIFQVKPKQVDPRQRYFEGVIWVDDRDLAIVKSYGKFVNPPPAQGEPLPFAMFETYRENIDGKYWFPTYMRSDDAVSAGTSQVPIRLTIRSKDLKVTPGAPATKGTEASKPNSAKPPQD